MNKNGFERMPTGTSYQLTSHDTLLANCIHNGQNFRSECNDARNTFFLLVNTGAAFFTFFLSGVGFFYFCFTRVHHAANTLSSEPLQQSAPPFFLC